MERGCLDEGQSKDYLIEVMCKRQIAYSHVEQSTFCVTLTVPKDSDNQLFLFNVVFNLERSDGD